MVQIVKHGAHVWELSRVQTVFANAMEYELIGRVVREGDLYYAELPIWSATGYRWERKSRKFLVPKGAFRAIIDGAWKKVYQ